MAENSNIRGVHNFAIATACSTILLLVAGALVTSNDAADSVPDWPLAYGRIIPPLIGGIRYEFAHRVVAGLVAILTVVLAVWISFSKLRSSARRWGWIAFALVVAQAFLGAARVKLGHAAVIATIHATVAQIFFITLVSLTMFTSDWWQRDLPQLDDTGSPKLRSLSVWLTAVILVQLVLGAGFRHGAFGILPHLIGFPRRHVHGDLDGANREQALWPDRRYSPLGSDAARNLWHAGDSWFSRVLGGEPGAACDAAGAALHGNRSGACGDGRACARIERAAGARV